MLRELPVDFVKIDDAVISAAVADTQAQAVLLAIIAYARRAGAYVIAEGIESEQILSFVRNADELDHEGDPPIKGGQGFLLGKPSSDVSHLTSGAQSLESEPPRHGDAAAAGSGPAAASA